MLCPACAGETDDSIPFCILCGHEFPDAATTLLGTQVDGRYTLEAELGAGGMGDVYRATDATTGTTVAIKLVLPAIAHDETTLKRFHVEAQALTAVCHPHLVRVLGTGTDATSGRPYLAMSFVDGIPLDTLVEESPLPPETAWRLVCDVTSAVATLHAAGWLHRDIKPSNVLVTPGDRAVLLDAGIARSLTANMNITLAGEVVGTPQAMAPEQIMGRPMDVRTDVYQLGMLLFSTVLGQSAFSATSTQSWYAMHLNGALHAEVGTDLRGQLSKIGGKAIATNPDDRFPTAAAMLAALEAIAP